MMSQVPESISRGVLSEVLYRIDSASVSSGGVSVGSETAERSATAVYYIDRPSLAAFEEEARGLAPEGVDVEIGWNDAASLVVVGMTLDGPRTDAIASRGRWRLDRVFTVCLWSYIAACAAALFLLLVENWTGVGRRLVSAG